MRAIATRIAITKRHRRATWVLVGVIFEVLVHVPVLGGGADSAFVIAGAIMAEVLSVSMNVESGPDSLESDGHQQPASGKTNPTINTCQIRFMLDS